MYTRVMACKILVAEFPDIPVGCGMSVAQDYVRLNCLPGRGDDVYNYCKAKLIGNSYPLLNWCINKVCNIEG